MLLFQLISILSIVVMDQLVVIVLHVAVIRLRVDVVVPLIDMIASHNVIAL